MVFSSATAFARLRAPIHSSPPFPSLGTYVSNTVTTDARHVRRRGYVPSVDGDKPNKETLLQYDPPRWHGMAWHGMGAWLGTLGMRWDGWLVGRPQGSYSTSPSDHLVTAARPGCPTLITSTSDAFVVLHTCMRRLRPPARPSVTQRPSSWHAGWMDTLSS